MPTGADGGSYGPTQAFRNTLALISDQDKDVEETADAVLETLADAAGTEYAVLSNIEQDVGRYVFEHAVSPSEADLQSGHREPLAHVPTCARVVDTGDSLALTDVPTEAPNLSHPELGIQTYLGAPVLVGDDIYGTFCLFDVQSRDEKFPDWIVELVEYVAMWLGGALERRERLDNLIRRCDHAAVIRDAAVHAIRADSREAVAGAACRRLAARDGYRAAWVGEPDPASEALRLLAAAGLNGSAEGVPIDLSGVVAKAAPGTRAYETDEVQVARTASAGEEDGERRPGAVIGVPIAATGTTRGALVVRADSTDAFEGGERRALADLGELLGHAMTAAQRKRVLTGGTIVRLELRVRDALSVDNAPDVRITLEDVARLQDGSVVAYGVIDKGNLDAAQELADSVQAVNRLERRGRTNGTPNIEIVAEELPAVSAAHARSGDVERAIFDGSDLRARVALPSEAEARRMVDRVTDEYPETAVISKHEVDREDPALRRPPVPDTLTDRQLDALRTAFVLGYYERPRTASGEEIADALGVAPATFSQHRRAAERKLLGAVFEENGG